MNYLIVYDIGGIQDYIFKTRKVKEISGASFIVRYYFNDIVYDYCKKNNISLNVNWKQESNCKSKDDFIKHLNQNNNLYIEYAFEGGGNTFLFFHGQKEDMDSFNQYLQKKFLKETCGLSLAYAYADLENTNEVDDKESFNNYRELVLQKLKIVKARMPRNNTMAIMPIMKLDPIYGSPILGNKKEDIPYDSLLKLKYQNDYSNKDDYINEIDKLSKNNDKNFIAVIHIDGNDIGGIINTYVKKVKANNFVESLNISKIISSKIDKVFHEDVEEILKNEKVKLILNSGDDITFICSAYDSFRITKKIIESVQEQSLSSDNELNNFSACAGICLTHPHFPFHKAYEIAEELCSNAKSKSKKYRVGNNKPTSWIDFEIITSGIIKSINEIRKENESLYLRPYYIPYKDKELQNNNIEKELYLDDLLFKIKKFNDNDSSVARTSIKEIRNTYEKSKIDIKILFEKLKSRNVIDDNDDPFINDKYAKYYDASVLIDFIDVKEEEC